MRFVTRINFQLNVREC